MRTPLPNNRQCLAGQGGGLPAYVKRLAPGRAGVCACGLRSGITDFRKGKPDTGKACEQPITARRPWLFVILVSSAQREWGLARPAASGRCHITLVLLIHSHTFFHADSETFSLKLLHLPLTMTSEANKRVYRSIGVSSSFS